MANTKKSFLGFKQVLKATYDAAVANKTVAGYIWFVRANASATDGDIYFGSRHYGHFSSTELSALETKLTELINANTTSISNLKKAIEALDVDDKAVAGQYVSAVSQTDGKITVTRAALPASKVDGVAAADKFLALGADKLISADITMSYDSTVKKIYLYGKDKNTAVSTIDATEFIKDGMLKSASFNQDNHILTLTFNTDAGEDVEPITVDLSTLVDTYKAGTGLVLATDGTFSLSTATQASLGKADSAIQSVSGDADTFAVVGAKDASNGVKVSNKVQKVSTASDTAKGLAEASDVKAELDKKVNVETGKRLMTNNEGTKLSGIAAGAQVNVIESIEGGNAIAVSTVSSKKQTVSLKIDNTGNVSLTQGANGLKASVTIPDAKVDSIASSGKTINVTNTGAAWNVDVNKAVAPEELGAHNIFLENGDDGALYGVMYYDGDDVE